MKNTAIVAALALVAAAAASPLTILMGFSEQELKAKQFVGEDFSGQAYCCNFGCTGSSKPSCPEGPEGGRCVNFVNACCAAPHPC